MRLGVLMRSRDDSALGRLGSISSMQEEDRRAGIQNACQI